MNENLNQSLPQASHSTLVIASRESALALWQAEHIQHKIAVLYPKISVSVLGMTTQGDQILDKSLAKIGGKGLFVKELEAALQTGQADIAVHSLKDVPMQLPAGFILAAIGEREEARDAFVSTAYAHLDTLPAGAIVGTSSLRRESQLRARYPHLVVRALRGNVQTRLAKLDRGEYAAIILAAAGLIRLGLSTRIRCLLNVAESVPAAGQGALAIEIASHRQDLLALLAPLNHAPTAACVFAERSLARQLNGSCQLPLGAYAQWENGQIHLRGVLAYPDGSNMIHAAGYGLEPDSLGEQVAEALREQGGEAIIRACLLD